MPPGVSVEIPLQSYFRLNAPGAGQFEHTLIIVDEGAYLHFIEGCSAPKYNVANLHAGCVELFVGKNATLRYSTIENWSKNMYNLNTKRALVEEGGEIEWVSGSFGSHVSYLYPMSILKGKGATDGIYRNYVCRKRTESGYRCQGRAQRTEYLLLHEYQFHFQGWRDQYLPKLCSVANAKAKGSKSAVSCQSLMLDDISRSDTIPAMDIRTSDADVGHEAKIGRISDEAVFYLMSQRHQRRGSTGDDRQWFCRQCIKGTAAGICGGDEQSDSTGNEGQHRMRGVRICSQKFEIKLEFTSGKDMELAAYE